MLIHDLQKLKLFHINQITMKATLISYHCKKFCSNEKNKSTVKPSQSTDK